MKTAIIKTDFWKKKNIYKLLPDTRYFYLCLLTNPERNATPAFECDDRLMTAYTGYNQETITLCRQQLIDAGFILFMDDYYIINDQDYVQPHKGKLSGVLYEKEFALLPLSIQELLMSRSSAAHERIGISSSINKSNNKKIEKVKEESEVSKLYYEVVKVLQLPIRNHNNLRNRIKAMEAEIGTLDSINYLSFLKTYYTGLNDDGYKPRLMEALDVYGKRVAVRSWIERTVAENNRPKETGGRPII